MKLCIESWLDASFLSNVYGTKINNKFSRLNNFLIIMSDTISKYSTLS